MIVGLVKGRLPLKWEILAWASLGGTHSFPIETLPQAQPLAWATVPKCSALAPMAAHEFVLLTLSLQDMQISSAFWLFLGG